MPVLKKGCCCGELETCARIVGWVGVVFALLNIFGYFIAGYHWIDTLVYTVIGICHLIISALLMLQNKTDYLNLSTTNLNNQ